MATRVSKSRVRRARVEHTCERCFLDSLNRGHPVKSGHIKPGELYETYTYFIDEDEWVEADIVTVKKCASHAGLVKTLAEELAEEVE